MARQPTKKKQTALPKELGVQIPQKSIYDFDYCLFAEGKDLQFPYSVKTYEVMGRDAVLAAALNIVQTIALRVPRYIEPYNETDTHKKRADFINECLGVTFDNNDMTHSFDEFLREALSVNQYGFSIHEKVFRVRRRKYGSKYDDGKVGIKRLPIRPQNSIEEFKYDDAGRDITTIIQRQSVQRTFALSNIAKATNATFNGNINIPRDRVLLIKTGNSYGKGEGVSQLYYAYDTWRDYQRYKDLEGIAASKNLNGLPVLSVPADIMTSDPNHDAYNTFNELKDQVSKIAIGQQTAVVLPSNREDMTGQGGKQYELQLLTASSSNITAITAIIQRLEKQMRDCLFAGEIGENLDTSKTSFLNMLVESRIKEIFTVINCDLIPHLFRENGWDETKTPKLKYGKLREIPFSEFAKAIQQLKATNSIAITPENINFIAEQVGLPYRVNLDATQQELKDLLGVDQKMASRSGDGLSKGSDNGTSDKPATADNSANNLDNK